MYALSHPKRISNPEEIFFALNNLNSKNKALRKKVKEILIKVEDKHSHDYANIALEVERRLDKIYIAKEEIQK